LIHNYNDGVSKVALLTISGTLAVVSVVIETTVESVKIASVVVATVVMLSPPSFGDGAEY